MRIVNPSPAGDKPSVPTPNGCWESWLLAVSYASIQAVIGRERVLEEHGRATARACDGLLRENDSLRRQLDERRAA